ncbi:DUF1329 domain-containing protein [Pseudomonas parakoreensis]
MASGWSRATLKPGERHIYAKRVFYLDEDSWRHPGLGHL